MWNVKFGLQHKPKSRRNLHFNLYACFLFPLQDTTNWKSGIFVSFFNILIQYHTLLLRIHYRCEITECWTKIKSYLKRTKFTSICAFPACTSICYTVFLACSRMYDCGPASAKEQSCARPYLPEKDTEWLDSWFLRVSSSCCLSWRLWWFSHLLFHRQLCSVPGDKPS